MPDSSARSTRTSNQLSMLRPRNCTDTAYTSAPGRMATSRNSAIAATHAKPSITQRSVREVSRLVTSGSKNEPVPFGPELPFARGERVLLERLGQLAHVEADPHGGLIPDSFRDIVGARDRPRGEVPDEALDIVERVERLAERAARDP